MFKVYLQFENLPTSLNVKLRSHWAVQRREAKLWHRIVENELHQEGFPEKPLTKVSITLRRHAHRMLDYDGLVGSFKPIVDALKKCGVIVDDSWSVTGAWNVSQRYRPKAEGVLLEVIVAELPDKRI